MRTFFRRVKAFTLFFLLSVVMMAFQNCSVPYTITPTAASTGSASTTASGPTLPVTNPTAAPPAPGTVPVIACTPQTTTANLRVMFLVDASRSTVKSRNGDGSIDPGTDPQGTLRTEAAYNFIKANSSLSNLSYSYSYFAVAAETFNFATSLFMTASNIASNSIVFGSTNQEVVAINKFAAETQTQTLDQTIFSDNGFDTGGTNYQKAFSTVTSLINVDRKSNLNYNYVVIFMSDGQPNIGGTDYITYVQNVVAAAGGATRATVSGVYFGPESSATAISNIQNIAAAGGGEFADINSTSLTLDNMIQNLIKVPTGACH